MLLYIWSESLILVMIVHIFSNALLLASKGVIYDSETSPFVVPLILAIGTLAGMIYGAYRQKGTSIIDPDFWISINLKD
jgi:hypothetical protein